MRESTASFLRLWGVATFFVVCGIAVGIHKMSDPQVLAVWGMGNRVIPLPAPMLASQIPSAMIIAEYKKVRRENLQAQAQTLKQQAETIALSHMAPKALVRVQNADGSIKFVPVEEQDAEAKATAYRLKGLHAEVQYKEEK